MYRNSVVAHLLHFQFGEHPLVGLGLAWNSKLMRHASAKHHSSFHSASGMSGMPKRPSVGSFLQPMLKKGTGGFVSESSYLRPYCSISLKGSPPPPPPPCCRNSPVSMVRHVQQGDGTLRPVITFHITKSVATGSAHRIQVWDADPLTFHYATVALSAESL